jgi:predicted DNA-binding protein (UPF0251 family)
LNPSTQFGAERDPGLPTRFKSGDAWTGNKKGAEPIRLTEDELVILEKLSTGGFSQRSIAKRLGVAYDTLQAIVKRDPEASEAVQRGRAAEHDGLCQTMLRAALNGNVTAGIFLLKARHGYVDSGLAPINNDNRVAVQITLPAAMSPEQYAKMIEVQVTQPALPACEGGDLGRG